MKPLRVFHGWRGLTPAERGAAVAVGKLDGLHLGHQAVVAEASAAARRLGAPLGVVSFETHPLKLFDPGGQPFRLTTSRQFARVAERLVGVQRLYLLPFGQEMADLTERLFVERVLVGGLRVRHVAVGFNFVFGKDRAGTPDALRRYGDEYGFSVSVLDPVRSEEGEPISSSAIRALLRSGDPRSAAKLLGRPFAIEGVVAKGRQLGRKLGFPTANVDLGDYVVPKLGVYATRTRLRDGRELGGVANLGQNPTTGIVDPRLEVFLFDFSEEIYGETIETDLLEFLRPEVAFRDASGEFDVQALVAQMHRDAAEAKRVLSSFGPGNPVG